MSRRPLVSVVTIFLDAERFLADALRSVLEQSYDAWELILVDDGSRDASSEIARRFAADDRYQISCHEHPLHQNRGMSASRNLGIRHAAGDLIGFLDADDLWLPRKLEEQVDLFADHPRAQVVYGKTLYWHSWSGAPGTQTRDRVKPHFIRAGVLLEPPRWLELMLDGRAAVPSISNLLARRTAVEGVGGFEERFVGAYEDQVFHAKLGLRYPVYVADAVWDKYRQHANSSSARTDRRGEHQSTRVAYLEWLRSYLEHQDRDDARLRRKVARELWLCRSRTLGRLLLRCRRFLRRRLGGVRPPL